MTRFPMEVHQKPAPNAAQHLSGAPGMQSNESPLGNENLNAGSSRSNRTSDTYIPISISPSSARPIHMKSRATELPTKILSGRSVGMGAHRGSLRLWDSLLRGVHSRERIAIRSAEDGLHLLVAPVMGKSPLPRPNTERGSHTDVFQAFEARCPLVVFLPVAPGTLAFRRI